MTTEIRYFNPSAHVVGIDTDIRALSHDGEPWFVGSDVCKALALYASEYRRLADDEKGLLRRAQLGLKEGRPMVIVSEPGLYKLIMRSDKPQARRFQRSR